MGYIQDKVKEFENDFSFLGKSTCSDIISFLTSALTKREKEARASAYKEIGEMVEGTRETLAELEHEQWVEWSKNIAASETISLERAERWKKLWKPYAELSEAEKDQDRKYADKIIAAIKDSYEKLI